MLAFGAPVARLFGSRAGGALRFAGYFMVCGIVGGLVYWALHPSGAMPIVGASGAVYGLVGGVARLVEHRAQSPARSAARFCASLRHG
jgi:membrane associated rhomboid family serine protease